MSTYIYDENVEQFRPIAGYPDYEIGDHGTVSSLKFGKVRVLKSGVNSGGYLIVGLLDQGKQKSHLVHRLVATAFCENPENKKTVNHINGNQKDNRSINLEFATQQEQIFHVWNHPYMEKQREILRERSRKTGLHNAGEGNGACKLSDEQCDKIRKLYASGQYTQRQIADDFGCSQANINFIINNKRRKRQTPALKNDKHA